MIVSHSQKFIFIHIEKNAGTSITRTLDNYMTYKDLILGCSPFGEGIQPFYKEKYGVNKHSNAIDVKSLVGKQVWNDYFSFSFVRNPWDRVVSLYTWCRNSKHKLPICQEAINSKSFSDFIKSKCFSELPQQLDYISDTEGNIIVNFVGRQEFVQRDFSYICGKIGIDNLDLHAANSSNRNKSYQDYYNNDRDIEIIHSKFFSDVQAFNYRF